MAATLAVIATLIVGHPTPVACHAPAGMPWTGNVYGYTVWNPRPRVYLRACRATLRRVRVAVVVFAHELIHVEHPSWAHPRVYRMAPWYARIVARVLRRHS